MNHHDEKQISKSRRDFLKATSGLLVGISSYRLISPDILQAEDLPKRKGENPLSYWWRQFLMPGKIGDIDAVKPSELNMKSPGELYVDDRGNYFSEGSDLWLYSEKNKGPLFILEDIEDYYKFIPPNFRETDKELWEKINYKDLENTIDEIKKYESFNGRNIISQDTSLIRLIELCTENKEGWSPFILGYGFPARRIKGKKIDERSYTITEVSSIYSVSDNGGNGSDSSSSGAATGGGGHGGGDGAGTR